MKNRNYTYFISAFLLLGGECFSKEAVKKETKKEVTLKKSAYDYYSDMLSAYQEKQWKEVVFTSRSLVTAYPDSPFTAEAFYYQGIAFFHLQDFDMSNICFSKYLRNETTPKYFEEAIGYKFLIADKFYEGAKKHILGLEKLPKIMPAKQEALEIYEEIITTLPRHDLTAQSLYKKGVILCDFQDFKLSVEAFQVLIRRFPKHSLAPEAFLGIQKVYLKQSKEEFPDPDILELALINLNKFSENFPSEPRIEQAEQMYVAMQDSFAKELFETAGFYERTKKDEAAFIYYTTLLTQYPQSSYAQKASKQIQKLTKKKQGQKK
jgi:outer membrane protein assembly factor BamD (BamD/ComL family)